MMIRLRNISRLPGWVTVPQAAKMLRVDRGTVRNLIEAGAFRRVHYVGDNRTYLLPEKEVAALVDLRDTSHIQRVLARLQREQRAATVQKMRTWGREHGFDVHDHGALSRELQHAYRQAHRGTCFESDGKA